jgi:hypothetical protein
VVFSQRWQSLVNPRYDAPDRAVRGTLRTVPWLAILIAVACACGGPKVVAPQRPQALPDYTATRWIPPAPTYAISARTVRDLQRAIADAIDMFGIGFELEVADIARAFAIDPISPGALAAIGVDIDGGAVVFSERISPTLVVRLSAPHRFAAFVRERQVATRIALGFGTAVEWVVDGEWLWMHLELPIDPIPNSGWRRPRTTGAPTWTDAWQRAATKDSRVAGFIDAAKLPKADNPCAKLLAPVSLVELSSRGDGTLAIGRLSFEIGAVAAAAIRAATMSPPEGWDAASRSAALALQWNVDAPKLLRWAAGCTQQLDLRLDLSVVERAGVRTARAMVFSFDPASKSGTGAVALDLSSRAFIDSLLDRIPWRTALDTYERFGSWSGQSISVPFGPTIDYVLTDRIALAGMGEGVLARAVGKGEAHTTPPVFALDILPRGMSADAWRYLFALTRAARPDRSAERLQRWKEIHVTLVLDGTRLVFEAAGSRK